MNVMVDYNDYNNNEHTENYVENKSIFIMSVITIDYDYE